MKQTKLALILLLLFNLSIFSANTFAQDEPPPEEEPVETCTVFYEDFEDGELETNPTWEAYGGSWEIIDGQLHADSLSGGTANFDAYAAFIASDYLEFSITGILQAGGNLGAEQGIGIGLVDQNINWYSMLMFSSDSGYPFTYQLEYFDDIAYNPIVSSNALLMFDTAYNLRTVREAGVWSFYVNDTLVGNSADAGNLTNFIAVSVLSSGDVIIDNIEVIADCESVNQAPVAEDFDAETIEDSAIGFNLLDHASDPDGDPLTATVLSEPEFGSLSWSDDGNATYTPEPEWAGVVSFEYLVNDGELDSNVAVVHIIVLPVNDAPDCSAAVLNVDTLWPPNHREVPLDVSGVTDVDSTIIETSFTDISHDEAINGLGDGNTDPDWDVADGWIRAERSGTGDGRVYSVGFMADDLDWTGTFEDPENYVDPDPEPIDEGACEGSAAVTVPHDQRPVEESPAPPVDNSDVAANPPVDNPAPVDSPVSNPPPVEPPTNNAPPATEPPADNANNGNGNNGNPPSSPGNSGEHSQGRGRPHQDD